MGIHAKVSILRAAVIVEYFYFTTRGHKSFGGGSMVKWKAAVALLHLLYLAGS